MMQIPSSLQLHPASVVSTFSGALGSRGLSVYLLYSDILSSHIFTKQLVKLEFLYI
jgi:hypothetical protein